MKKRLSKRLRKEIFSTMPNPITVAKLEGVVNGAISQLVDGGQIQKNNAPVFRALMGMMFGAVVEKAMEVEIPAAGGHTERLKVTKAEAQRVGMNSLVDLCRLESEHAFGKK